MPQYYESRFLTLGQRLPGQAKPTKSISKKPRRIYRPGVEPKHFLREDDDDIENLLDGDQWNKNAFLDDEVREQREILQARVIDEVRQVQQTQILEDEDEDVPEKAPLDLSRVDINNLKVEEAEFEASDSEDEVERRRARALAKSKIKMEKQRELLADEANKADIKEESERLLVKPLRSRKVKEVEVWEEVSGSDGSDSSSDEDSDGSSSEDEIHSHGSKMKLAFIPKKKRAEMKLETFKMQEERVQNQEKKKRKKEREKIVREELISYVRTQETKKDVEEEDMPDDDDDIDQEEQFELWKIRELKRMKRVQDELDKLESEKEETERRRHMTDAEINAMNLRRNDKERTKMKFLQRYHHKGAFFQDEDEGVLDNDLMKRDLNAPTGSDVWMNYDSEYLPKVMKVKNFGLASRTKYTHLVDQDTTQQPQEDDFEGPTLPSAYQLSGTGPIQRPTRKGKKRPMDDDFNYQQESYPRTQPGSEY